MNNELILGIEPDFILDEGEQEQVVKEREKREREERLQRKRERLAYSLKAIVEDLEKEEYYDLGLVGDDLRFDRAKTTLMAYAVRNEDKVNLLCDLARAFYKKESRTVDKLVDYYLSLSKEEQLELAEKYRAIVEKHKGLTAYGRQLRSRN